MNKENLQLIAKVKCNGNTTELYLKEMYRRNENFKSAVFVCAWYNVTKKKWSTNLWSGEENFINYDNSIIDTSYIQDVFTLVNRCTNSYFCNSLYNIENITYYNNRFILNELNIIEKNKNGGFKNDNI